MATLRVGNLGLDANPIQLLADWHKVREHDWRRVNLGFNEIAVWYCGDNSFDRPLPETIQLPVTLTTSYISPLGRSRRDLADARYDRFLGWSGLEDRSAFGQVFSASFSTPSVEVPHERFLAAFDKRYRVVLGYVRRDRHILLTPEGGSPQDDYLLLCLPEFVRWHYVYVGICGTERTLDLGLGLGPEEPSSPITTFFTFDAPGPYQKLNPARSYPIYVVKAGIWQPVPTKGRSAIWRRILREDAQKKRVLARRHGGSLDPGGRWAIQPGPDFRLEPRRYESELERLSRQYG